jgi:multisubunit Na+/H+ antiporter MnhB subunit
MNAAFLLIMIGAFGKSAQFPFHFWLPAAMAAPTPVSAYLHSATMVKMGIFLTARIFPIFSEHPWWFPLITSVCFSTMLLGAWLALRSNDLKAILAYSTISQLGFLMGFYGLGSSIGVRFDFVHILNHVFYKGCLFMVAGIVDHCAGTRDVRRLGGLAKVMPLTAFAGLVGAAALAGFPLTTGFISKEIILADLVAVRGVHPTGGVILLGMVILSALFTVAFAARLFLKVFTGAIPAGLHLHAPSRSIQMPPVLLAGALIFFGIFPGFLENPLDKLRVAQLHAPGGAYLKLWHGFNFELLVSFLTILAGGALYLWGNRSQWRWTTIPGVLRFDLAFEQVLESVATGGKKLTNRLHANWPPAYLPILIASLLAAFVWAAVEAAPQWSRGVALPAGVWTEIDPLRAFVVVVISFAAFGVVFLRRWSAQLVALSVAGFLVTFYFVLYRAPDLAMTQILVESASVVMILLLLSRFPRASQQGVLRDRSTSTFKVLRVVLSIGIGCLMTALLLFADAHRHPEPIGMRYLELTRPLAEGTNAVNTVLVDFRGFDTLGEITVLLIAALGGMGLLMRFRRGKPQTDIAPPPGFLLEEERQP